MKKRPTIFTLAIVIVLIMKAAQGQTQTTGKQNIAPSATSTPVTGSGTTGQLVKWTGSTGSTSIVGDSGIFEDKFGKVGIGTRTPTSLLTVAGMIEITLGGLKFPDGTIQTTSAANALLSVVHNESLQGNGTATSPLGVAVPLLLTGSVDTGNGVVTATNTAPGGPGMLATGGNSSAVSNGGPGLLGYGGNGGTQGGVGVIGLGGLTTAGGGGTGGNMIGGGSTAGYGGDGVIALGGLGTGAGKKGGRGIFAISGDGIGGATPGLAGEFFGDVTITGNLAKGSGSFKIDHPLDPENKYLYHSFVESPDMMNIYNGNIITDANGEAVVEMPDYFEALNRDFRYQLTVIGQFAQAIVAEKIKGNQFRIKTNAANVEVSWQVTGVRHDAYANKHRIPVEEVKSESERGYFLHADAFNQPQERSLQFVRNPEMMQQIKEQQKAARLPNSRGGRSTNRWLR
jgi:hypothetical protein